MKTARTLFFLIVAVLAMTSAQTTYAQQRITTKNYNVSAFSAIESNVVGNIFFTQSDKVEVTANGSEELLTALNVQVKNGVLVLTMDDKIVKKYKRRKQNAGLKITISAPILQKIDRNGVGNITLNNKFSIPELLIKSEGVGNLTAADLDCNSVKIDFDGVGNITLRGITNTLEIVSEGVGNVETEKLKANEASITSEGVGNISCYASDFVKVRSEGIGNVTYYGKPARTDFGKKGIGKIRAGN